MNYLEQPIYLLNDVEFDPARNCLRRNGDEHALRQKSLQVLLYLIEHRERSVGKEELLQNVWNGTAVTDDALVQIIVELRKLLGDDSRQPRFIKTIPKAGYRFIAPVTTPPAVIEIEETTSLQIELEETLVPAGLPAHQFNRKPMWLALGGVTALLALALFAFSRRAQPSAETALPRVPGKQSVAVLYFENQSGERELDWLREGLADMLITDLSRTRNLTLLSRQHLAALLERSGRNQTTKLELADGPDIARRTQADVIALGSFAKLGERLRVDVRLFAASNGQMLSAESLTVAQPGEILTQLDLLSLKLAAHLGAQPETNQAGLTSAMTGNLEAYRYYSLALEKAQALHHDEALALLEKAVALDPQFAMAHARIGYVYAVTWGLAAQGKPPLEKAFQLAHRLTEKDRLYITAWYAIANLDYPNAAQTLRQLLAQYPLEVEAYWRLGRLLLGEEQYEEAIATLKRGLVVDAEAKDIYNALGVTYRDLYRHAEAIAMSERYVQLAPQEPNARDSLALAYQGAGQYGQALAEYQQALRLNPKFEVALLHVGNLYFQTGRYAEALQHYERYIALVSSDWDRAWGYGRMAWVFRRKGDLRQAAAAAQQELRYDKSAVGNSLLLALERGDQTTTQRLGEQLFAARPYTERGLRPALRSLYFFQGSLSLKRGNAEEAIQHFKEALKHRPLIWDIDSFEDCLANAYLELGQTNEAIAEYEKILKLNPNYPLAHYHLGQAYERQGDREQVRAAYQRFLQVWHDSDADVPEIAKAKTSLAQ
ncbi:MAG: tetratricopeptide repeat protein [Acidobacteria bacterium]|nr:tetratricopeptide repeat protein [Acidobacteriota bacterium]